MNLTEAIILNPSAIVKPSFTKTNEKVFQKGNCYCLYDSSLIADFNPQIFSGDYWLQKKQITGTAQGRGTTFFIQNDAQQQWVLRHYYRGGLIGKLIHDSYWFTGINNTRAVMEYQLLHQLTMLGLPAPQPIACQVIKTGLRYRANIITARIEQAEDLVAMLQKRALEHSEWQRIGQVIKQFHQHHVYHHDLNSHNILIDNNNKIWLIDFDRGAINTENTAWQQENLARLLRSFRKEKERLTHFHWQESDWQALLSGYQSSLKHKD